MSVTNGLTTKTAMLGIALPIGKREGGGEGTVKSKKKDKDRREG